MALILAQVGNFTQYFNADGNPLAGGLLFTYYAGSTTAMVTTYNSINGDTANSNPIVLDSSGYINEPIWYDDTISYQFVLTAADGETVILILDNLGYNPNVIPEPPVTGGASVPQVFTFTYEDIDLIAVQTNPIGADTLYAAPQTYVELDGTDLLIFDPGTYRIDIQGQLLSQDDISLWFSFNTSYGPYLAIDASVSIVNSPNYIEHYTNSSNSPWDNNGPSFNDTFIVQSGTEQLITIQLWAYSTFAEGERASGTATVTITRLSDDAGPWA